MSNKNIILHPIDPSTGELDTTINLYPKTNADDIEGLDEKIAASPAISHLRNRQWTNQTVTGTPTAVSSYAPWDTKHEYGYYLDLNITGLEEDMVVTNIAVDDVTQELVGFNVDILDGKVRFYLKDATAVTLTILEMRVA